MPKRAIDDSARRRGCQATVTMRRMRQNTNISSLFRPRAIAGERNNLIAVLNSGQELRGFLEAGVFPGLLPTHNAERIDDGVIFRSQEVNVQAGVDARAALFDTALKRRPNELLQVFAENTLEKGSAHQRRVVDACNTAAQERHPSDWRGYDGALFTAKKPNAIVSL